MNLRKRGNYRKGFPGARVGMPYQNQHPEVWPRECKEKMTKVNIAVSKAWHMY